MEPHLTFLDHFSTGAKGLLGSISLVGGTSISFMQNVEISLRIASLVVGICVGLATLFSILKGRKS